MILFRYEWEHGLCHGSEMEVEEGCRISAKCWKYFTVILWGKPSFHFWGECHYDGWPYADLQIGWLIISWGEQGSWEEVELPIAARTEGGL